MEPALSEQSELYAITRSVFQRRKSRSDISPLVINRGLSLPCTLLSARPLTPLCTQPYDSKCHMDPWQFLFQLWNDTSRATSPVCTQHPGLAQPFCLPRRDLWPLLLLIRFVFLANKGRSSDLLQQPCGRQECWRANESVGQRDVLLGGDVGWDDTVCTSCAQLGGCDGRRAALGRITVLR